MKAEAEAAVDSEVVVEAEAMVVEDLEAMV
jgi:hypothetical protein